MKDDWVLVSKATEFVAEEMGVALKRSAISPNIRERMDHSCAVLSRAGEIVAQAEHIPVHLGSFHVGTARLLRWLEEKAMPLADKDMIVVNDPYISGTHLNDLMILAPIMFGGRTVAYVVNKAHIVDVGGPAPGSLNPEARILQDEGLVLPPTRLVKRSKLDAEVIRLIQANFKDPETALGDINAQIAANRMGISRMIRLFERFGRRAVLEGWQASIDHTRRSVQRDLSKVTPGQYRAIDFIEVRGTFVPIRVRLNLSARGVEADFSGSAAQIEAPLNAVFGVTYSATAFAVRCIVSSTIPTNGGFYGCVKVRAPHGSIVNPDPPAPVSGGNVETSQRIADVVLRAMSRALGDRIPAASAGTMMNVMLGGRDLSGLFWAYYETVGGGSGARSNGDGISGVQTNMTNTLNTPIEVAEMEYPLFYTEYRLRPRSGGLGRFHGGDGIIRSFRVRAPTSLSILSDRFLKGPWGREGGKAGTPGRISILRGKRRFVKPSKFVVELREGDEVVLETPGGGGFGKVP